MPFFPDFLLKNRCSHTQFILKIRLFFKEQTALKSMFCQKNVHSVKNTLPCHFFLVFYEKSPAFKPIFGKKNVGFVKITLYFGSKKLIGCPSFLIFHGKKIALMHIFCQKIVHSLKRTCSYGHIMSKTRLPLYSF